MRSGDRGVAASRATVVRLMIPTDANFMGNVFGGVILSEIDRVSYVTATRHARTTCVTASMDRVDFRSPVHVGDMVEFRSELTYVGRTSMEVLVQARSEPIRGGPPRPVVDALVTMVAVGPDGHPVPVPRLRLTNAAERRRFEEGRGRMAARKKSRAVEASGSKARAPRKKVNR
ncbi:MAG: acyl-CoA thioesterase [Thermoplasmata archaeon]|nr:acyl-CoA thioesterase [Thermoplasmata archaeon]